MLTISINDEDLKQILLKNEDYFLDFKSKLIKPCRAQECFVSFANSDGGIMYIGIEDEKDADDCRKIIGFNDPEEANSIIIVLLSGTNPAVEGVEIEFLETRINGFILAIYIPKSPKVHYTSSGDCYVRLNAATQKIKGERITSLGYSKGVEPYEKKMVTALCIDDIISSNYLIKYMESLGANIDRNSFLRKQGLVSRNPSDGKFYVNVGCVLMFEDSPQGILDKKCGVKVIRLGTTDTEYRREQLQEPPKSVTGPLENLIDDTIDIVSESIEKSMANISVEGTIINYPSEALREILVNAIIHRDYSINDDIHVRIYDNRVEIQSPGKLPGYMSIDNLYTERFSRNPNLVRLLHNLPNPVNHDIGEGLDTAKNELRKAGLIPPIFSEGDNYFLVTIKHEKIASVEVAILNFFRENPDGFLTNKKVRELSGEVDMQKVKVAFQKLRKEGRIALRDESASTKFKYEYRAANIEN